MKQFRQKKTLINYDVYMVCVMVRFWCMVRIKEYNLQFVQYRLFLYELSKRQNIGCECVH